MSQNTPPHRTFYYFIIGIAVVGLYYPALEEAPDALPLWATLLIGVALVVVGTLLFRK